MKQMKKPGLSASVLKYTAVLSMAADHTASALILDRLIEPAVSAGLPSASALLTVHDVLRGFGRIAFPVFAFFIAEGFVQTKSLRRYILRIALFALLSEIPFDLCLYGKAFYLPAQNVLWEFLAGLLLLAALDKIRTSEISSDVLRAFLCVLATAAAAAAAWYGHFDYDIRGILLILLFYVFRSDRAFACIGGALILCTYEAFQIPAVLGFLLLYYYSGERGSQKRSFFYLFYPLHFLLIKGICLFFP